MGKYHPRDALAVGAIPSQSPIGQWYWSFHTVLGVFDPGNHRFRLQLVGIVKCLKDVLSGDGNVSSPGCGIYIRSPASQRPASGTGVSIPCCTVRPGRLSLSSPGCRSCRCMDEFLILGWDTVVPAWRGLYFRAPANQPSAGAVGVSTPCGAVSTLGSPFSSPLSGL